MKMLKRTVAAFLAAALSLLSVNFVLADDEKVLKAWSFEDTVPEDIISGVKVSVNCEGGVLNVIPNNKANAAFNIGSADMPINLGGEEIKKLKLRMKITGEKSNTTTAPFLIGYATTEPTGAKSLTWDTDDNGNEIEYGGDFKDYVFDLTKLEGLGEGITVTQITIQPVRLSRTAIASFEKIELWGVKTIIPPSVTLTDKTGYPWYEIGDTVEFEADVQNADSVKSVEFFVNGKSVGNLAEAPYKFSYEFTEIGEYKVKAVATLGDDTIVESPETLINCLEHREKIFKEWTFDDNQKPADINCGNTSTINVSDGALSFTTTVKNANLNISPYNPLDFTIEEYPYLKLTVKNTMPYDVESKPSVAIWLMYAAPPSNGSGEMVLVEIEEDISGAELVYDDGFYRQYIYDLSKASGIDKTKPVKWLQTQFFRHSNGGTAYIDRIAISDTASYDAVLDTEAVMFSPKNGEECPMGKTLTLAADTNAKGIKSVEYFVNGKSQGMGEGSKLTLDHTFDVTGKADIYAKITLENGEILETDTVSINVTAVTVVENVKWDFESDTEGWYTDKKLGAVSWKDGALVLDINAESVPLRVDNLNVTGTKVPYLKIRIKNETNDNNLTFQWAAPSFSTANRFQTAVDMTETVISKNDTEFKEYIFDLTKYSGWLTSGIKSLQFFPVTNAKSGRIIFDSIELYKIIPEVNIDVSGDMVYPKPITVTPSIKTAGAPIVKTELYINGEKVKETTGADKKAYTYIPAVGGKNDIFYSVHDGNGEVTFSETVSVDYKMPYEFGEAQITTDGGILSVKLPVRRALDGFNSPVIFAAAYDKDGRMLAKGAADVAITEEMTDAEISYAIPESAAKVIVYAWDSLLAGESYQKPLEVKIGG